MTTSTDPVLLRWETLTKRKFDQLDRDDCVVLVTCSPLEVHGPHLPFGADALEGEGLSRRMLRFLPERHRRKTFLQLPFIYAATDTLPHPGLAVLPTVDHPGGAARSRPHAGGAGVSRRPGVELPRQPAPLPRHRGRPAPRSAASAASAWSCIFSVLLKRLTGGSAELYDVLGQLPGREPRGSRRRHARRPGGDLAAARPAPGMGRARLREPAAPTVDTWLAEQRRAARRRSRRGKPAGIMTMIKAFQGGLRFFRAETYAGAPGNASPELGERILDTPRREGRRSGGRDPRRHPAARASGTRRCGSSASGSPTR